MHNIFDIYSKAYERQKQSVMSIREYLEGYKKDPSLYATAAERMLKAIGEPTMVNTAEDSRLGRIFMNRTIKVYPAFADFFGLEERKQILYLLSPVGGGKSSLAELPIETFVPILAI